MSSPNVLAFAGSLRQDSFNHRLVELAARGASDAGADVTVIRLADYPLPLFDEDLEAKGTPEEASRLKELMIQADGMLIATPEYNRSLPAVLKNAIDWASRPGEGEDRLAAFAGKAAGVLSASPSPVGGLRSLFHLREILSHIQMHVLPSHVVLPHARQAFDGDGSITDQAVAGRPEKLGRSLVEFLHKHAG